MHVVANWPEGEFRVWAERQGWAVSRNGWPDFLCARGSEVMAVEVKWSDGLRPMQRQVLLQLAALGIPTFIWSPADERLESIAEILAGVSGDVSPLAAAAEWKSRALAAVSRLRTMQRAAEERVETRRQERQAWLEERDRLRQDLAYLLRRSLEGIERPVRLNTLARRYPDLL